MKKFFYISITLFHILVFAALAASAAFFRLYAVYQPVSYRSVSYHETSAALDNPFRGFHHMYGFTLSEEDPASAAERARQYINSGSLQLMLIQINLKNYADADLSANALAQLDLILGELAASKCQVILRFLYDWDGKALETEPSSIEQIMRHMEQAGAVVNEYAESVFIIQSTFTGNCGEMTQTKFGSHDDNRTLMTQLAQVTDPCIFLAVRTPSHLRGITQTRTPVSEANAYDGSLNARLGLFNDGMLGSVYDLGTYDDTPNEGTPEPEDKGTREEELSFQDALCQFVPNGGEAILYDDPYSDLDRAVSDLARMHVTYLNCDHDSNVMDKWRESTYRGDDCFDGMNGYDYINAHLGYRYLVSASGFSCDPLDISSAQLTLTIQNTGFAPAYRLYDGAVTLQNEETGVQLILPVSLDNRTIKAGSESTFVLPLDLRGLPEGVYHISFGLTDPYTGRTILFANEDTDASGKVRLGTLSIDPVSPDGLLSFLLSRWQNK